MRLNTYPTKSADEVFALLADRMGRLEQIGKEALERLKQGQEGEQAQAQAQAGTYQNPHRPDSTKTCPACGNAHLGLLRTHYRKFCPDCGIYIFWDLDKSQEPLH